MFIEDPGAKASRQQTGLPHLLHPNLRGKKNVETLFDLCCQAFAFIVACRDDETSSDIEMITYDNSGLVNMRILCGKIHNVC